MVKTAVITGANRGIGLRVAKNLIDKEFKVILACRSEKKGLQAEQYLGQGAKFLPLDLSSKPSIEHFSEIVLKETSNIDVLYNNAGLIYNPYQLTEEGYESMIAVNVYGSFRLSLLLLENIERAQGKLLQVTSLASYLARSFSINNLHSKQDFSPSKRYNLTNLLRSMFALELDKSFKVVIFLSDWFILVLLSLDNQDHMRLRKLKNLHIHISLQTFKQEQTQS